MGAEEPRLIKNCTRIVKHERAVEHVYHVDMQIFLDEMREKIEFS